jgi:hypothetical protein
LNAAGEIVSGRIQLTVLDRLKALPGPFVIGATSGTIWPMTT